MCSRSFPLNNVKEKFFFAYICKRWLFHANRSFLLPVTLFKCVLILFFIILKFYIQRKHLPLVRDNILFRNNSTYLTQCCPHTYFSINLDTLNLIFNLFFLLYAIGIDFSVLKDISNLIQIF